MQKIVWILLALALVSECHKKKDSSSSSSSEESKEEQV
jgi:hypothetical protein